MPLRLIARGLFLGALLLGPFHAQASSAGDVEDDLLRSARVWAVHGRGEFARTALNKLLAMEPDHAEGLLQLGLLEIESGHMADAEIARQRLMDTHPGDFRVRELGDAIRIAGPGRMEMANIRRLLQTGEVDEAWNRLQGLFPDGPPAGRLGIEYFDTLSRRQGGEAAATRGFDQLVAQHPQDPRFQLARLRHQLRHAPGDRESLDALEALGARKDLPIGSAADLLRGALMDAPDSADVRQRLRRYLERWPDDVEVRSYLGDIERRGAPSPPPARAAARPEPPAVDKAAPAAPPAPPTAEDLTLARWRSIARGAPQDAVPAWADAIAGLEDGNYYRAALAAESLSGLGANRDAETILRDLQTLEPGHHASLQRLVPLLEAQHRQGEALDLIETAEASGADVSGIRADLYEARAEDAAARGKARLAEQAQQQAVALDPADPWRRYRLARMQVEAGRSDAALALIEQGLRAYPSDDLHYAKALLQSSLDQPAAALNTLLQVPWERRSPGMRDMRRRLEVGQWIREAIQQSEAGESGMARQLLIWAIGAAQGDPELLARCEALRARLDEAASAPITATASAAPLAPQAPTDEAPQRRHRLGSARLDHLDKPGDEGVSSLKTSQIALMLQARHDETALFAQADILRIDAGTLRPAAAEATDFGSLALASAAERAAMPAGLATGDEGAAIGVGLETQHWTFDLGTRPLGFEQAGWTGGIRYDRELGPLDGTLTLSRRAVTSSRLSYAGARDPFSGEVWGAVSRKALALRLAHYEAAWSLFFAADGARYEGSGVPDNEALRLWAGGDHDLLRGGGWRLEGGLRLSHWRYDDNQRYYSLGHGGYYSPQRYSSVSLPLDFTGRGGRFGWRLRAAPAWTDSREDDAPRFPNNARLQSSAAAVLGVEEAYYDGDGGGGFGWSMLAAGEYLLRPNWVLGAQLSTDRSDYYEPVSGMIYVRRGRPASGLGTRPETPEAYADR